MNYYETLYIVHPAFESSRLKDIIINVEDCLKKNGGKPLYVELIGKKKLAYFTDKQKYGSYILIQFKGEGKCTNDFALELEHNADILAYLTTKIDEKEVNEQEKDLDAQITGKTREIEDDNVTVNKTDNTSSNEKPIIEDINDKPDKIPLENSTNEANINNPDSQNEED